MHAGAPGKTMQHGIRANNDTAQRFKDWESLSRRFGCSTPHPIDASSRRFPVLLIPAALDGRQSPHDQIDVTGMDSGRVIASPRIGAHGGGCRPIAIHVGSSKARPERTPGASAVAAVGGAGTFDDMFDRVAFPTRAVASR